MRSAGGYRAVRPSPAREKINNPDTEPVPQVLTEHKAHIAVRGLHLGSEIHVRDGERGAVLPVWAQLPQFRIQDPVY